MTEKKETQKSTETSKKGYWPLITGLSILGSLAFAFYTVEHIDDVTRAELDKLHDENVRLTKKVTILENRGAEEENKALKEYVDDSGDFIYHIRPWLNENDSGCEDPNCEACKKIDEENEKNIREFNQACDTLGIDPKRLQQLQMRYIQLKNND